MKIFDISVPITPSMPVWPGDPPVKITLDTSIEKGGDANVTHLSMSVHTGTHLDAPKHFINSGKNIGQISLENLTGEVLVVVIDEAVDVITDQVLENHFQLGLLKQAKKVLFKTRNSKLWETHHKEFQQNFVGIDASGAQFLSQLNLELIGIDYLSIAPFNDTKQPHEILLSNDIILLEGIDLSLVPYGIYDLVCLPLKIPDCEGAPARVILLSRT